MSGRTICSWKYVYVAHCSNWRLYFLVMNVSLKFVDTNCLRDSCSTIVKCTVMDSQTTNVCYCPDATQRFEKWWFTDIPHMASIYGQYFWGYNSQYWSFLLRMYWITGSELRMCPKSPYPITKNTHCLLLISIAIIYVYPRKPLQHQIPCT